MIVPAGSIRAASSTALLTGTAPALIPASLIPAALIPGALIPGGLLSGGLLPACRLSLAGATLLPGRPAASRVAAAPLPRVSISAPAWSAARRSLVAMTVFGFFKFRFALRRDGAQRDSSTLVVDAGNPRGDDVTHLDGFVKIFDVRIRNSADVNQPAAIGCQFNEDAKWHHADDHADDLVSRTQVLGRRHGGQDSGWASRRIAVTKRIAKPLHELLGAAGTDLPFLDALINLRPFRFGTFDRFGNVGLGRFRRDVASRRGRSWFGRSWFGRSWFGGC